ncbi:S-adenosyl-L-methionine-dependent methyltransferase [Whalleya microplaca]|nr:S-adenosyl-L-methionine-dependent methyltransferase [Whalleya microplaca]
MASESIYTLNDATESFEADRLSWQHGYFQGIMNDEPLPQHITTELSSNPSPKILDLATGTGIWLTELAKVLPASAELDGLDFDSSKYPQKLPANIKLGYANIFEPFPEELHNRYDVVNIRFLVLATKIGDGVRLVSNVLPLLKPGGWIVWTDKSDLITNAEPPSSAWFKYQQLSYSYALSTGRDLGIPLNICNYFKEAGYTNCDEQIYFGNSLLYGPRASDHVARTHRAIKGYSKQHLLGIVANGGVDDLRTQEDATALISKMEQEISGDRRFHFPLVRAWGHRPL